MKTSDKEFLNMLKKQKELEIKVANELNLTINKSSNEVVKLLLDVIRMDSLKHAHILQSLEDIIQGKIFSSVEKTEVKKALDKHIIEEQEMLNKIEEILKKVEGEQVKLILEGIVAEEHRHHASLKQLYEFIEKIEGLTEEDLWDYLNKWANFST
jgi:rubrerythrin